MEQDYAAYLALLGEVSGSLEQLCGLAQQKADVVRQDNLIALDEVLKQEQAISLALRGYEQKRLKLSASLALNGVPLSGLAARCPAGLQQQAKETVERLQQNYEAYRTAAALARNTLECNLHELERIIEQMGGAPTEGAGYVPPNAEPPKNMKTDFRA